MRWIRWSWGTSRTVHKLKALNSGDVDKTAGPCTLGLSSSHLLLADLLTERKGRERRPTLEAELHLFVPVSTQNNMAHLLCTVRLRFSGTWGCGSVIDHPPWRHKTSKFYPRYYPTCLQWPLSSWHLSYPDLPRLQRWVHSQSSKPKCLCEHCNSSLWFSAKLTPHQMCVCHHNNSNNKTTIRTGKGRG